MSLVTSDRKPRVVSVRVWWGGALCVRCEYNAATVGLLAGAYSRKWRLRQCQQGNGGTNNVVQTIVDIRGSLGDGDWAGWMAAGFRKLIRLQ